MTPYVRSIVRRPPTSSWATGVLRAALKEPPALQTFRAQTYLRRSGILSGPPLSPQPPEEAARRNWSVWKPGVRRMIHLTRQLKTTQRDQTQHECWRRPINITRILISCQCDSTVPPTGNTGGSLPANVSTNGHAQQALPSFSDHKMCLFHPLYFLPRHLYQWAALLRTRITA